ncbi:MAG: hypothetical protein V3S51_06190 [Dehalococcoidia bacterium]
MNSVEGSIPGAEVPTFDMGMPWQQGLWSRDVPGNLADHTTLSSATI